MDRIEDITVDIDEPYNLTLSLEGDFTAACERYLLAEDAVSIQFVMSSELARSLVKELNGVLDGR